MPLLDDLRVLSEQVRKRQVHIHGEEATKQALVLPFFQALGYDIYDPTSVQPEFIADFAKKKANGQMEKVDYALHSAQGVPALFVECKAADREPTAHDPQLARYFNAITTVKVAIISNGIRYRFFTDLRATNVMDDVPYFEFNVLAFNERDVENLSLYTRDAYAPERVQTHAEEMTFLAKVTPLVNELLRNPPESFIRYLLDETQLVSTRVTQKVIDKFTPIVRKAVQTALLEMMTKSLRQEISPTPSPPVVSAMPIVDRVPDETPSGDQGKIVTTEEELDIFRRVKATCDTSVLKAPVAYKDTVAYFGINLGKVTRWFLRVFTGGAKKSLAVRVPLEKVTSLVVGFDVEKMPDSSGCTCRVYFAQSSDLDRLRPLVLAAYEQEVARKEIDAGDAG